MYPIQDTKKTIEKIVFLSNNLRGLLDVSYTGY